MRAVAVLVDLVAADGNEVHELVGEHLAEPDLALLMAAVGERSGEERHLGHAVLSEEPPHDVAGQPPRLPVVDADISQSRHTVDIGHQCHDGAARPYQRADALAHRRMIDGDQGHAISPRDERGQPVGDGGRIEHGEAVGHDRDAGHRGSLTPDAVRQVGDERIRAIGQQDMQAHRAQGTVVLRQIAQVAGCEQDRIAGSRPDPRTGVDDPVHRRGRHPGRQRDILQGRSHGVPLTRMTYSEVSPNCPCRQVASAALLRQCFRARLGKRRDR